MANLSEDGRALLGLMLDMGTAAENYRRLSGCFSGWQAETLNRMARETRAQSTCIGGICALIMGEPPKKTMTPPDTGPLSVRLKKAYGRAMHLLSSYEAHTHDPEYGPVFQRLAIKQQEHCRKILELIGSM